MLITGNRRTAFESLSALLSPAAVRRLAALGITTTGELTDQWTYGKRALLTRYIPELDHRLQSARPAAEELLLVSRAVEPGGRFEGAFSSAATAPPKHRPRGVLLTPAQKAAPAPLPAPLAASPTTAAKAGGKSSSLVSQFPAVRNQGARSTCVAFATVAWAEYQLRITSGRYVRLSEQFAYWGCKQDDSRPGTQGTFVSIARVVARDRGICRGSLWPYTALRTRRSEGQGPPPSGAREDAREHRVGTGRVLSARNHRKLCESLDADLPVVLSVRTFESWDFEQTRISGEISLPVPGDRPDGGHAILLVGYERNASLPGGGAFIFRNSWGTGWGTRCRFGAGYGTLPFGYLKANGLEAFA